MSLIRDKIKQLLGRISMTDFAFVAMRAKRYKGELTVLLLAQIPIVLITIGLSLLFRHIIDAINSHNQNGLMQILIFAGIISLIQAFVQVVVSRYSIHVSSNLCNLLQQELLEHINQLEYKHIQSQHSGRWLTLMTNDADSVSRAVSDLLPKFAGSVAMLIGGLISLVVLYPPFIVVPFIIAPFGYVYWRFYSRRLKKLYIDTQEKESRLRTYIQDALGSMSVIKAFGNFGLWRSKLTNKQTERTAAQLKRYILAAITGGIGSVAAYYAFLFMLYYAAGLVRSGTITLGTLMTFIAIVSTIIASFKGISGSANGFVACLGSAKRLRDALSLSTEKSDEIDGKIDSAGIKIENLTFGYEEGSPVLKNISLNIPSGSMVGIIGASGVGKSTLINLIEGFYKPDSGKIYLTSDSQDIEVCAATRRYISYVPQGNTLFSDTVLENVISAFPNATEDDIHSAIRIACAEEFIGNLPDGLNTVVGEKGARLSAGQAQRISIARALLRKAPILLLDEAASFLDPQTEMTVFSAIYKSLGGITRLVVTHRPEALDFCDFVIVLQKGGKVSVCNPSEAKKIMESAV